MYAVTNAQYIHMGCILLVVCSSLILILTTYFSDQVEYSANYDLDICTVTDIFLKQVIYHCWNESGNVNMVYMPCVEIYVNTSSYKNLIFYRSIQEKMQIKLNNLMVKGIFKDFTVTDYVRFVSY